jgi:nudix-type nucleoside diphosphatase (YffH/AdpP family)
MTISDRVRVKNVSVLSDRHYRLNEVEFDYRRGDGEWQTQKREVFDRGHAATLLPYNLASRTVVLTRQFRLPAYLAGHDDLLIEAAAGMLDDETPEKRIRAEAEEEIGYRLGDVRKVFEAFMSPGSVTEKLHSFDAGRRRRRPRRRRRGYRGAGAADRFCARDDIRRPHRRCQDHHAAAIRCAAYFSVRTVATINPSW